MGERARTRLLGVDFGARRIGVAVSEGRLAVPLAIVEHRDRESDLRRVAELVRERGVDAVVVGLPLLMSGEEGEQARRTRRFGEALARRIEVPVVYQDERLSSFQAAEAGAPEAGGARGGRRRIDDVAATVILQAYIDATEREG